MARTSTYLNFPGTTEAAFTLYKSVFGTGFIGGIMRMGDAPPMPCMPGLSEAEKQFVMHMEVPILGGHVLMGTDTLASMGPPTTPGTNISLNLEPDTRAEADRLFAGLAEGGTVMTPLQEMFWGAYYGVLKDRFGIQWMVNCTAKA